MRKILIQRESFSFKHTFIADPVSFIDKDETIFLNDWFKNHRLFHDLNVFAMWGDSAGFTLTLATDLKDIFTILMQDGYNEEVKSIVTRLDIKDFIGA